MNILTSILIQILTVSSSYLLLNIDTKEINFVDSRGCRVSVQWPVYLKEDPTNRRRLLGQRFAGGTLYDFEHRKEKYKEVLRAIVTMPLDDPGAIEVLKKDVLGAVKSASQAGEICEDIWRIVVATSDIVNKKYVKQRSVGDVLKNKIKTLARKIKRIHNRRTRNFKFITLLLADLDATATLLEPVLGTLYWHAMSTDWARLKLEKLKNLNIDDKAYVQAIDELEVEFDLRDTGYWYSLLYELQRHRREFLEQGMSLGMVLLSIESIKLFPLKVILDECRWIKRQEDLAQEAALAAHISKRANSLYGENSGNIFRLMALKSQVVFYDVSYKAFGTGIGYIFSLFHIKGYNSWRDYLRETREEAQKALRDFISDVYASLPGKNLIEIYGGEGWDEGYSFVETEDGGYLIVGATESFGNGGSDVYVVKVDKNGELLWGKTYGGLGDDYGYFVIRANTGDFIVVGSSTSRGKGKEDVYLLKIDRDGNKVFEKYYGGVSSDVGYCVRELRDGTFVIVGRTESFGAGASDVYLLRVDAHGNLLWSKTYGGNADEDGYYILKTGDNNLLIVGYTESFGKGWGDVYVLKVNPLGKLIWAQTAGGSRSDWGYSAVEALDGGYVVTGWSTSFSPSGEDVYVVKFDRSGKIVWERSWGGEDDENSYSICRTNDGYLIAGWTLSYGSGGRDIYLLKIDENGDLLWDMTLGKQNYDVAFAVKEFGKAGYILIGWTESYGATKKDVFLMRTNGKGDLTDR